MCMQAAKALVRLSVLTGSSLIVIAAADPRFWCAELKAMQYICNVVVTIITYLHF